MVQRLGVLNAANVELVTRNAPPCPGSCKNSNATTMEPRAELTKSEEFLPTQKGTASTVRRPPATTIRLSDARRCTRVRGGSLRGSSKGSLVLWRPALGVVLDGTQTVRWLTNEGEWAARARIPAMIRVLVADDHDVVRCGLRKIFETQPTWEVVAEAADGEEAVRKAFATVPDVAVIDYSMPTLNGAEVARRIRRRLPNTEVLIFTMYESEALIAKVLRAGARGYLLKSDASGHLVAAVEALAAHKPFLPTKVFDALACTITAGRRRATVRKRTESFTGIG